MPKKKENIRRKTTRKTERKKIGKASKPSRKQRKKYLFVVGGVLSGVGKGITSSSIAKILQARGYKTTCVKADPYVNVDAGTMNPTEHGEVFVMDDGYETDQDMGNYERFLDTTLPSINYMTTGRVYQAVIEKERNLEYKGKCVEVVPHVPLEIIRRIKEASKETGSDITIVEIGGTIGEYQNILFLEAARMMKIEKPDDVGFVMVSYLPIPSKIGEMKTKPTQYAVRALNSAGIHPDIIIARSRLPLDKKRKEKLATFCNINIANIISAPDIDSIYEVPINFDNDGLTDTILKFLSLKPRSKDMKEWRALVKRIKNPKGEVNIAIIGKYFDTGDFILSDAYISVIEAIKFSSYKFNLEPKIHWLNSKDIEKGIVKVAELKEYDGVIVPGGFGETGVEGKIKAIKYARENEIPYFGLCYGMQLSVIEYARNVLGWKDAHTREINPESKHLVIDFMTDQKKKIEERRYGGTMRLGAYPCILKKGSIAGGAYGSDEISERHRHRYEVSLKYIEEIEKAGLIFSGKSPDGRLMEIAELPKKEHPFFLGTQFHPEFLAHPLSPHPLFTAFIKTCLRRPAPSARPDRRNARTDRKIYRKV